MRVEWKKASSVFRAWRAEGIRLLVTSTEVGSGGTFDASVAEVDADSERLVLWKLSPVGGPTSLSLDLHGAAFTLDASEDAPDDKESFLLV